MSEPKNLGTTTLKLNDTVIEEINSTNTLEALITKPQLDKPIMLGTWEWVAAQEKEADHGHPGQMTSRLYIAKCALSELCGSAIDRNTWLQEEGHDNCKKLDTT